MKYLFLVILCWAIGFLLPIFTATLQWIIALIAIISVVICVYYYIDTRINAIRL